MRRFVGTLTAVLIAGTFAPLAHAAGAPPGSAAAGSGNPAPVVVPSLREWHGATGAWRPHPGARIVAAQPGLRSLAARFADELRTETGVRMPVTGGRSHAGDVVLSLGSSDGQLGDQGTRCASATPSPSRPVPTPVSSMAPARSCRR